MNNYLTLPLWQRERVKSIVCGVIRHCEGSWNNQIIDEDSGGSTIYGVASNFRDNQRTYSKLESLYNQGYRLEDDRVRDVLAEFYYDNYIRNHPFLMKTLNYKATELTWCLFSFYINGFFKKEVITAIENIITECYAFTIDKVEDPTCITRDSVALSLLDEANYQYFCKVFVNSILYSCLEKLLAYKERNKGKKMTQGLVNRFYRNLIPVISVAYPNGYDLLVGSTISRYEYSRIKEQYV